VTENRDLLQGNHCVMSTTGSMTATLVGGLLLTAVLDCGKSSPLFAADPATQSAVAPPNIVVIFMDDMGYADPGPFGGDPKLTPNLNRMAEEGRRFTDFYVSQAVCSASRCSLLTGCYNVRLGILGALGPSAKIGLNPAETTIAEVCREQGYATACFGKWHLGHHRKFLPLQQGFDEYFGLPYSNDMWPYHPGVLHLPMEERLKRWPHLPLIEGNEVINPKVDEKVQSELTRLYTEKSVSFIERNRDKPFFLYLPHSMVHVPLFAGKEFLGKSGKGLFADVMMEIDWSVGQILETLQRLNLDQNTLVIFTSDNGPWLSYGDHAGSAAPLREGKGTMFDGGCRVSCVMRWPGKIPAGSVCDEPLMTIDLLPTISGLVGGSLPKHTIDGLDILPQMIEPTPPASPHDALYFYYGRQLQAVRSGKWKLHFQHGYRTLNGREGGTGGIPVRYQNATIGQELFDLHADISETTDVSAEHPEVVQQLTELANQARAELGDNKRNGAGSRPAGQLNE